MRRETLSAVLSSHVSRSSPVHRVLRGSELCAERDCEQIDRETWFLGASEIQSFGCDETESATAFLLVARPATHSRGRVSTGRRWRKS